MKKIENKINSLDFPSTVMFECRHFTVIKINSFIHYTGIGQCHSNVFVHCTRSDSHFINITYNRQFWIYANHATRRLKERKRKEKRIRTAWMAFAFFSSFDCFVLIKESTKTITNEKRRERGRMMNNSNATILMFVCIE